MKLKTDFVTNSSSCNFIMFCHEDEFHDLKKEILILNDNPELYNEGSGIDWLLETKEELIEYTTGRPYDWASKTRGIDYVHMPKRVFEMALEAVEDKHVVFQVQMDRNYSPNFEEKYQENIIQATYW